MCSVPAKKKKKKEVSEADFSADMERLENSLSVDRYLRVDATKQRVPGCQSSEQLQPIRISQIILRTKSPRSGRHVGPIGQSTVNKSAPMHYIIPINNMVHRPL